VSRAFHSSFTSSAIAWGTKPTRTEIFEFEAHKTLFPASVVEDRRVARLHSLQLWHLHFLTKRIHLQSMRRERHIGLLSFPKANIFPSERQNGKFQLGTRSGEMLSLVAEIDPSNRPRLRSLADGPALALPMSPDQARSTHLQQPQAPFAFAVERASPETAENHGSRGCKHPCDPDTVALRAGEAGAPQSLRARRGSDIPHGQDSETLPAILDRELPESSALLSACMLSGSDQPHLNENSTPETSQTQQNIFPYPPGGFRLNLPNKL